MVFTSVRRRFPVVVEEREAEMLSGRTSEGGFHGGLHHADKQLEALWVLGQARSECCQGVGMTTQVLQCNPLTKVGLR